MEQRKPAHNFEPDDDAADLVAKPRTTTVLLLLAIAAATFSYLGAYAVTAALANAEIIPPIPHEHDPRLRWALTSFIGLMLSFGLIALFLRNISRRQFRRIDRMNDADEG